MLFDIPSIKLALPIGLVLESRGVRLRRGRGPCPICGTSERSTAFSVRNGRWRCFACNEHGDVVDLVAKVNRVPLREAIRRAAALAGVGPGLRRFRAHTRPKSEWQIKQEARGEAWRLYLEAIQEREHAAKRYEKALRHRGGQDGITVCLRELLAEAYDQEVLAEHVFQCAIEDVS